MEIPSYANRKQLETKANPRLTTNKTRRQEKENPPE